MIDIFDKQNEPTGKTTDINTALKRGYWCRGAHVIIASRNGSVLLQKRSLSMTMHPGLIDISCGGYVDAGETPTQAAVREVNEELGIRVLETDLKAVGVYRHNRAWPKLRKKNRAHVYLYTLILPDDQVDISKLQLNEVAWAKFVPMKTAQRLVKFGRNRQLGRLNIKHRLYREGLSSVQDMLKH